MEKVVIITGGTQGIGLGMAKVFLSEGYQVVMNYHSDDRLAQQAVDDVNSKRAILIKADISTKQGRDNLLQKTLEKYGRYDVLINNAAIIRSGRFLEIAPETFEKVMNCNFYGALYLSQAFANALVEKAQKGAIINISSVGAYGAGNISYCTSKAALLFLTRCMAKELAKHNIRVNSISPGAVPTNLNRTAWDNNPDQWIKGMQKIPMKRAGSSEEIARAAVFLASEHASYITGVDLPVDGGKLC